MTKKGTFSVIEGVSGSGKTTLLMLVLSFLKEKGIVAVSNEEPTVHGSFGKMIREIIERRKPNNELVVLVERDAKRFIEEMNERMECVLGEDNIIRKFCEELFAAIEKVKGEKTLLPRELQMFYVVDRYYDLRDFIIPHIEQGHWVINDRFLLSTFAYGGAYGVNTDEIYDWHSHILGEWWHLPRHTFYTRVSAETASQRLFGSGKTIDIWEKKEKLQSLIDYYEMSLSSLKKKAVLVSDSIFYTINAEVSEKEVFEQVKNILRNDFKTPS